MQISKTVKTLVSNYVRTKIAKLVGKPNSTILHCLERICLDLDAKCLKVWTITNSGGQTYMFASLDTEGDNTIVTIGYCDWKTQKWVSAK